MLTLHKLNDTEQQNLQKIFYKLKYFLTSNIDYDD